VKKLRKSVNICQSYHKNKCVSFFTAHSVQTLKQTIYNCEFWMAFITIMALGTEHFLSRQQVGGTVYFITNLVNFKYKLESYPFSVSLHDV